MSFLQLTDVTKFYGSTCAVQAMNLSVEKGEFVSLLGPSGCGKTTTLQMVAGFEAVSSGRIALDGRDITRLPAHARAQSGIGRSFQTTALFENFTIAENLMAAAMARRSHASPKSRAGWLADHFGLWPITRPVAALDHGTRRALDLAMALAGDPRLVLMDEPSSGLGPGGLLHNPIGKLPRDLTMILIEHDLDLAFALADRVLILNAGRVAFDGAPDAARPVLKAIYDA